jgi:hypothetical protein
MGLFGNSKKKKLEKLISDYGLTPEEFSLYQGYQKSGNEKGKLELITNAQERKRKELKETTGIDTSNFVAEIGKDIFWNQIVNHIFKVLDFDRSDTTIEDSQVKAKSLDKPYGYLLVESPILNNKARLPIIHRDDFQLVASVFDEPKLAERIVSDELLVVYSPKHLTKNGLSSSPHHVLHYIFVPSGTLDSYYSMNNDEHFAKPDPQKLFGQFVYEGEIKVQVIPEPKL